METEKENLKEKINELVKKAAKDLKSSKRSQVSDL